MDAAEAATVEPEAAAAAAAEEEVESREREIGLAIAAETTTSPGERHATDAMALEVPPAVIGAAVAVDSEEVVEVTEGVDEDVVATVVDAAVAPCLARPAVDAEGPLRIKRFIMKAGLGW